VTSSRRNEAIGAILVGYRPDGHGDDAVALARLLAETRLVTEVVIVEIVDDWPAPDAERRLAALAEGWPQPVRITARAVADESVPHALHSVAESEGADALVLGSTHRGLPGRVFAGTTTEHLSHDAGWPILVAPEGFRDSRAALHKIGVAYDGSDESQGALDWAVGLASQAGAELRLIAVVEPPPPPAETWAGSVPAEAWSDGLSVVETNAVIDAVRERKEHELAAARASIGPAKVETMTIVGDVLHELRAAAEELDMLVAGSARRGRFEHLMLGDASGRLAYSCPAPLALVPITTSVE
jgi:nucleotide-binding universal stress UspA family protein